MTKRNEEKFRKLSESFNRTLEKMKAMNDEELCDYIDDEADKMFSRGSGICGSIDLLFFEIPFTTEELANYLDVEVKNGRCSSNLNKNYLMNEFEVLEHFLIEKKEEFYKSITDYIEMKLTDNGINKKYDDLIEKLNSMDDEEFADYMYRETDLLTNTLSGGIYGFIGGAEFETKPNSDEVLNLPKEDNTDEEKMYKTILVNKRREIIESLKKSKEEELKMYLESETFF
ncbi:MAG: hypothetical protein ACLVK5_00605 [Peptoniphilus senegalensis]